MTASGACSENGVRVARQRKELAVEVKVCVQQYGAIALGKRRQGKLFISTSPAPDIAESSSPRASLLDEKEKHPPNIFTVIITHRS